MICESPKYENSNKFWFTQELNEIEVRIVCELSHEESKFLSKKLKYTKFHHHDDVGELCKVATNSTDKSQHRTEKNSI